ncbi:MAG: aspartate-semialdehyde dehydrogenase [Armatimonadota bacterium]
MPSHIAIVGATGAVGAEFLNLFQTRKFPVDSLKLLASARSAGKKLKFGTQEIAIEEATTDSFSGVDVAFFSAGATRSKELIPAALAAGALVIDNSSAFRMDPEVPLVVPEVNSSEMLPTSRLISVPNCTAILLCVAINSLRTLGKMERLIVSTYQSASGGGAAMMHQLEQETRALLADEELPASKLNHRYAFNLFSHNTAIGEDGYNEEESKVIEETRKILGMPSLKINVTCVRVPVLRAHTETVTIEFDGPAPSVEAARSALSNAPGVRLVDDRQKNIFPTPLDASGRGDVLVGRVRQDLSNPNALSLMLSGDQLLKGAALNAVQIAELALSLK